MSVMRVLHLDLGRELRGGQRQALYLTRFLVQSRAGQGVATALACPAGSPLATEAKVQGLEVIGLPGRRPWDPRVLAAAWRAGGGFDILHTHDAQAATLGALLSLARPQLRLVHTRRVSYPLRGPLSRWKYARHHAIAAVSAETAQVLAAEGLDLARIRVIHSAIDLSRYAPRQPHDGPRVIGIIGALTLQKGHAVFLEALARLRAMDVPAFRARIVGEGPLRSGLEALAARLGMAGATAFEGYVDSREVLPGLDVLAVPSVDGEGSSAVIKEGWAGGVPVVASDLPSNLELVTPGANGLAVAAGSAEALAQALGRLLTDPPLVERLVAAGRRRVEDFSVAAMGRAYAALYAGVLAEP